MSTLGFHVRAPGGADGRVVELERPAADGTVALREWSAAAYLAPAGWTVAAVDEVAARVRVWQRDGWTFTEPPARILHWLGAD